MKTAATLGGALSFGAMIKSSVQLQGRYIALAHSISNYSNQQVSAAQVQKTITSIAEKTGFSVDIEIARESF